MIDTEGKVIFWNKAMEEMTNVKAEEILNKGNYEYALPFYGERRPIMVDLVLNSQNNFESKYDAFEKRGDTFISEVFVPRLKTKGAFIWVKARPLYDFQGKIIGAIETIRDITERKRVMEKLQKSEKKLNDIIQFLPDATFMIDTEGKVIFWNKAMEEMTNVMAEEILNKGNYEYALPFYGERRPIMVDLVLNSQNNFESKYDAFEKRGDTIISEVSVHPMEKNRAFMWIKARPLYDFQGKIIGAIQTIRDITERKKAEQKVRESESLYHMAYDRANFYKDLFAHDMNNILQAILSGLQLSEIIFDDPNKREALKTNLRIMKNQIIRGANLISNVRKLSRLEEIELPLKKIEICNLLKNLILTLKSTYHTNNLNIQVHSIDKKLHIQANDFLVDVFENILINSVRHNRNPSVEITIKISRAQKNGVDYLKMEFQDNGKGIADSWKEKIFQRGYTEEKSVHGMGLGLSLVKKIIKNYNGEIWVEDRIKGDHSKGSNFILLIPEVN